MAKAAKAEKETPKTDLVIATEIQPAILFGEDHQTLEDLLQNIKKEVSTIVPDITTAKGRKEITANVSRITKSKTLLDKVGKEYNAVQKELLKTFDSRRKHAFTFLEDLQKEVRKPLTEWEDKEKARIEKCEGVVNAFIQSGADSENWMNYSFKELHELLETVEEIKITKKLGEFYAEAEIAKKEAIKKIGDAIQERMNYDNDQEELKKLREKAEKNDLEEIKASERAAGERAAEQKILDANNETKAAEQRAEDAENQRVLDAKNAEVQRKIDVEYAAKKERDRIEDEKQKEIEAEKKREADTKHRGKINRAAMKAIIDSSKEYDSGENVITEGQAKLIIKIIANNKVPNVKIRY